MTGDSSLVTLPYEKPRANTKGFRNIFSLLTCNKVDVFFSDYWEKRPVHFIGGGETYNCINENVFSRSKLLEIIGENDLDLETNLSAVHYSNNLRTSWPFQSDIANVKEVSKAFANSQTVQFFQPQRFSNELHEINAGFEHIFGSLAGASAYLTPAKSQGLAPHHDDVDVFVLQCEGSKAWNIWDNEMSLPEHHSSDIPRSSLRGAGTKVHMKKGDMLYLPRGTIHEALAESQFSTHVTISVYQMYNMKKLITNLAPRLLSSAFTENYELRKGLPLWMSTELGSFVGISECHRNNRGDSSSKLPWRESIVEEVKKIVDTLSNHVCLSLLDEVADEMTGDFVMHRLPPPDLPPVHEQVEEHEHHNTDMQSGSVHREDDQNSFDFDPASTIRMCDSRSMFCMVKELSGVSMLAMAHNKNNSRATHMGHPDHRMYSESESMDGSDNGHSQDGDGSDDNGEEEQGDNNDDDDDNHDDDEDDRGSRDNGESPPEFQWSMFLPLRLSPVIVSLQRYQQSSSTYSSESVTIAALCKLVEGDRIFPDEVVAVVYQMVAAGFVRMDPPTQPSVDKKKSKADSRKNALIKKNETDSRTIETGIKSSSSVSSDENVRKKKKDLQYDVESTDLESVKKRKKNAALSVSPLNDEVHTQSQSQIGHVVGGRNRFYDSDKKVKRKKLRSS